MSSPTSAEKISRTPDDVSITPRNLDFRIADVLATDWHGGEAFPTAFYNALSIMFPVGEEQFINAVKHYRDKITDPELQSHIRGFMAQESIHRREHQKYNEALCAARGYPLDRLEAPIRNRIAWADRNLPPIARLAATVAYEHWTAILADALLRRPELLEGAHPEMVALWKWHAIEESEHKAVAFDVYRAVGGTNYLRRRIMLFVTLQFFWDALRHMRIMLRDYEGSKARLWIGGIRYLFGKGGALRGLGKPWRDFFRRDFHPWDHDNRDVVASVARSISGNLQPAE
ncbi:MAG TPA: metal-dependent hydrolase [Parvibaculum sp.]|uniref:metal-dependent hydrolase n=1 Tax=Parvibaculum sp. TaxID=2024848 RepID=UPI002BC76564|nr:metal-dependent hydrolase [Parvibaculum sp.]HMM14397.1 metal-dependent hydrolase [Parvibaculum sp.]